MQHLPSLILSPPRASWPGHAQYGCANSIELGNVRLQAQNSGPECIHT